MANLMHKCPLLLFVLLANALFAQEENPIQVEGRQIDKQTIEVVATNTAIMPVTMEVDAQFSNARANVSLPKQVVIAPGAKQVLFEVSPKKPGKWKYGLKTNTKLGDALHSKHDPDAVYWLPFEEGRSFRVGQGYDGQFSHKGVKALDFDMDEGTPVMAARAGLVVKIKEDSNRGCKQDRCKTDANYVYVYHEDGTIANYAHLRQGGAAVEVGDRVEAGQLLGYSGNTGWSSGPHLHFDVILPRLEGNRRVSTRFLLGEGQTGLLQEGETYRAFRPENP